MFPNSNKVRSTTRGGSTSSSTPSIKKGSLQNNKDHSTTSNKTKALKEKEYNQIAIEVRERSKQLDAGIAEMMKTVKQKQKGFTGQHRPSSAGASRSSLLGASNNSSLKDTPFTSGLSRYNVHSVENDSLLDRGSVTATGLTVDGRGVGKVTPSHTHQAVQHKKDPMHPFDHYPQSKKVEKHRYQREVELSEEERDNLIIFLAKLKITTEDLKLSPHELRELLLPSDLTIEGETTIPLDEFTTILQSELGLPITNPEQRLLMEEYGYSNGLIDIKSILSDAGMWDHDDSVEAPVSQASRTISETGSPEKKELIDSLELSPGGSPIFKAFETLEKSPPRNKSNEAGKSSIPETKKLTLNPSSNVLSDHERQHHAHQQHMDYEQLLMENLLHDDKNLKAPKDAASPEIMKPADTKKVETKPAGEMKEPESKISDDLLQNEKVRKILAENAKLKEEMKAFDSNFFEELEDMKYRYSRVLEMVGEDPFLDNTISSTLTSRRDTRSISPNARVNNLPLSRLSWSTRNSMRAIDRASYTSPIVQGRRNLAEQRPRSISPARRSFEDSLIGGGKPVFSTNTRDSLLLPSTRSSGTTLSAPKGYSDGDRIREGKFSFTPTDQAGGTFTNLCERRLVFELSSHPKSAEITSTLVHKVMDIAAKNKATNRDEPTDSPPCIKVTQLQELLVQLGLQMTRKEIEILSSGFASDGKGGIDAKEFCDMIRTLVYNLVGNHYQSGFAGGRSSREGGGFGAFGTRQDLEKQKEKEFYDEFERLLRDVCHSIITYDRRAVLGTSNNLYHTLLKPFIEADPKATGMILFHEFVTVLKEMGVLLSRDEYKLLARPFVYDDTNLPPESTYPSSNLNHLEQFRANVLTGSLTGKMKTNPNVSKFLDSHHLKDPLQRRASSTIFSLDQIIDESLIDYQEFVAQLVKELQQYLDSKGGLPVLSNLKKLPWIIQEFELIDLLLTQLETMNASNRRKVLITLQYALENADLNQSGELDGFAILSALLNSGFRLQRYHRVQLLKAAEAYGGQLEYRRLVISLLQTAVNWSQTERTIIFKVLKSMGNTMEDRRLWLAKMKKELMERVAQTHTHRKASYLTSSSSSNTTTNPLGASKKYKNTFLSTSDQDIFALPIPPTIFLHVLRDLNVQLTPEEEATLLDCLDTERIIKIQIKQLQKLAQRHSFLLQQQEEDMQDKQSQDVETVQRKIHSILWNNEESASSSGVDQTGLPMIDYYSFIQFVSRHCGSWIDSRPDLYQLLTKIITNLLHPESVIQELAQLFVSFDEKQNHLISLRSFIICCHRCRMFANVDEQILYDLGDTLVVDGVGEIPYQDFILQLKGIHLKLSQEQQELINRQNMNISGQPVTIVRQFLDNATDSEFQTLLPLRNYLLQYTDLETMLMTVPDFQRLLREFSIVYQAQEFESFLLEIGTDFMMATPYEQADEALTRGATEAMARGGRRYRGNSGRRGEDSHSMIRMIDIPKLLGKLMKQRLPWYERNLPLVKKLLASLNKVAKESSSSSSNLEATCTKDTTTVSDINTLEMMNVKVINKIIARINAFSLDEITDLSPEEMKRSKRASYSTVDVSSVLQTNHTAAITSSYQQTRLIEWNIFEYILKSMGIMLTRQEVQYLCDVCDPFPECHRINPHILLDLLQLFRHPPKRATMIDGEERMIERGGNGSEEELNEAAIYALNHLQTLLWRAKDSSFVPIHSSRRSSGSTANKKHAFHSKYLHEDDYTSTTIPSSTSRKGSSHQQHHQEETEERERGVHYSHQQYRNQEQWQLDVQSIFKGFDYLQNGYIAYPDLLLIFKLINVTISIDLLRDIPFINFNTQLVNYPKLLNYLFNTSHLSKSQKFHLTAASSAVKKDSFLDDEEEHDSDLDIGDPIGSRRGGKGKNKNNKESVLPHAIQLLLNRIRSNISVFIINNHTMQEAWVALLRIFTQFDKQEKNYITSRDFLLAISILLTSTSVFTQQQDGHTAMTDRYINPNIHEKAEDLLFTKIEWEEILSYFRYREEGKQQQEEEELDELLRRGRSLSSSQQRRGGGILEDMKINYLFFCEMVLNIKEIEKKLKEIQRYLHTKTLSKTSATSSIRRASPSPASSSHHHHHRSSSSFHPGFSGSDDVDDAFFADVMKGDPYLHLSGKTPKMIAQSQELKQREFLTRNRGAIPPSSASYRSQRGSRSNSPNTRRQSSLSPSRSHPETRSADRYDIDHDPIAQRFQQSNEKYLGLLANRQYGDHSRHGSSSSPPHLQRHPSGRTSYVREENIFRENPNVIGRPATRSAQYPSRTSLSPPKSFRRPSSATSTESDLVNIGSMTVSRKEINDRKRELSRERGNKGLVTGGNAYSQSGSARQLYQSSHGQSSRLNPANTNKTVRFNWTS